MPARNVHFISGLPRSGSTLLCAILKQNPRFSAGVTSPVQALFGSALPWMGPGEFAAFFDDKRRAAVLRGIFDGYHGAAPDRTVFDTNRLWTTRLPLLRALYPDAKVICCVRQVSWILDSIERLLRANPLRPTRLFNGPARTVYQRAEQLLNAEAGLIGQPWAALREAWFSELGGRLIIIDYERLTRDPGGVMMALYAALDEAPFTHDFDALSHSEPDYDEHLGLPGLHSVRPRVAFEERQPCIPPDLFARHAESAFWARPELNIRGARII
jgi:sulfotransferase